MQHIYVGYNLKACALYANFICIFHQSWDCNQITANCHISKYFVFVQTRTKNSTEINYNVILQFIFVINRFPGVGIFHRSQIPSRFVFLPSCQFKRQMIELIKISDSTIFAPCAHSDETHTKQRNKQKCLALMRALEFIVPMWLLKWFSAP